MQEAGQSVFLFFVTRHHFS